MDILIEPNSRTFIVGGTGAGKTEFAIALLSKVQRLLVLDVKSNLAERMNLVPPTKQNWRNFIRGKAVRLQVLRYRLARTKLSEYDYYEDVFRKVLIAGNCLVYLDELLLITNGAQDLAPNLKELYVAGREPIRSKRGLLSSGNIGMVASAQRPRDIPKFAKTESRNFAVFDLIDPEDRLHMSGYVGEAVRVRVPEAHGFYWRDGEMREPVYIPESALSEVNSA